uniref:glycoside hydrolase family 2 TIM barrel-domain containing protein n=1 Tax=Pedobacter schmidteae TaxID=2201271 RepID=UPI000EB04F3D|nr:glycoside hydrolase family 2 TIM barrel-domain containing protein [Pedobacter schmidteae]
MHIFRKKPALYLFASALLVVLAISSCFNNNALSGKKNYIQKKDGKYQLIRNGKPYVIKGAAGYTHLNELRKAGGNTVRVWDTTRLSLVLDSAKANDLAVIVGLPFTNSNDFSFYNDSSKVKAQYKAHQILVNKFKHHPAVLMWCVGNELDFPYKLSYNNFYNAFNNLTEMIHREDPDHPVTTTVLNFDRKYIFNLMTRCDIDIVSFNIFSRITSFKSDLSSISLFWNGPYLLAEWGIDGPWAGTEKTAWGAYIENTSNKKAEFYLNRYQDHVPVDDGRLLGSFVFFWGHKQEGTHTWFSMFDEAGRTSEAVDVMKFLWTGTRDNSTYPQIRYMLLDKKGARDNIILSPNAMSTAEVLMLDQHKIKSIKWEIYAEDWYRKSDKSNEKKLKPIPGLIKTEPSLQVKFSAPLKEGPYRIFATIYDHNGHFATCNTPFYVITDQ